MIQTAEGCLIKPPYPAAVEFRSRGKNEEPFPLDFLSGIISMDSQAEIDDRF